MKSRGDIIARVLLGMAVGDALGLPREGMSRRRAGKMWGGSPLRHRLVFGKGMVSDDTEHACMVAQAFVVSRGDPAKFAHSLAWRLRWWLLALPAGVGKATLQGIIKLWIGFPPSKSGVFSAGNGPAMRAPVIGAYCAVAGSDRQLLRELVRISTRMTHVDPAAEQGAMAVAMAASLAVERSVGEIAPTDVMDEILSAINAPKLREVLEISRDHLQRQSTAEELASALGLSNGVSGYINHTVPVALFCWLRWSGDFRSAVEASILLGGDTDTVAAITGGLAGLTCGSDGIPKEWVDGIVDWPRNVRWMRQLSETVAQSIESPDSPSLRSARLFWPTVAARNAVFLMIVLFHGFRRLFPPY